MAFGVLPAQTQAVVLSFDEFSSFLGLLLRPGEDQEARAKKSSRHGKMRSPMRRLCRGPVLQGR